MSFNFSSKQARNTWAAVSTYEDKDALRTAGFKWSGNGRGKSWLGTEKAVKKFQAKNPGSSVTFRKSYYDQCEDVIDLLGNRPGISSEEIAQALCMDLIPAQLLLNDLDAKHRVENIGTKAAKSWQVLPEPQKYPAP